MGPAPSALAGHAVLHVESSVWAPTVCEGLGSTDQRRVTRAGQRFSEVSGANGGAKGILGRGKVKHKRERRRFGPKDTCKGGRQMGRAKARRLESTARVPPGDGPGMPGRSTHRRTEEARLEGAVENVLLSRGRTG